MKLNKIMTALILSMGIFSNSIFSMDVPQQGMWQRFVSTVRYWTPTFIKNLIGVDDEREAEEKLRKEKQEKEENERAVAAEKVKQQEQAEKVRMEQEQLLLKAEELRKAQELERQQEQEQERAAAEKVKQQEKVQKKQQQEQARLQQQRITKTEEQKVVIEPKMTILPEQKKKEAVFQTAIAGKVKKLQETATEGLTAPMGSFIEEGKQAFSKAFKDDIAYMLFQWYNQQGFSDMSLRNQYDMAAKIVILLIRYSDNLLKNWKSEDVWSEVERAIKELLIPKKITSFSMPEKQVIEMLEFIKPTIIELINRAHELLAKQKELMRKVIESFGSIDVREGIPGTLNLEISFLVSSLSDRDKWKSEEIPVTFSGVGIFPTIGGLCDLYKLIPNRTKEAQVAIAENMKALIDNSIDLGVLQLPYDPGYELRKAGGVGVAMLKKDIQDKLDKCLKN